MRILIRATNWVGDAIMALPALRSVRARFPEAHIAILARPYVADLYRHQQVADQLMAYDPDGEHRGPGRARLVAGLRGERFDTALLLQNAFDAAWLAWRAGIPERIGYARDGRSWLLTRSIGVPRPGEIPPHEKFYYLELLRRAGWLETLPDDPLISFAVPEAAKQQALRFLVEQGARPDGLRVAIGAGASYGSAKCWPPGGFARLAEMLEAGSGAQVILFGTSREKQVSDAILAQTKARPVDLTGKTAIADLPALLSQCHAFVGNDSGAMHVAAAVGLPVVAIFGPTDPEGTAPVTPRATVVRQKPFCAPCFLRKCPIDHRCMTAIAPLMVEIPVRIALSGVTRG